MSDALGLDLGTGSIKLVGLKKDKNAHILETIEIAVNPIGTVEPKDSEEQVKLVETIKKIISDSGTTDSKVNIGLPESQVFTRVIQLPLMSEAELSSAIKWEAEQHIPIPLSQVQLDWTVTHRPEKGVTEGTMQILLVAAKTKSVNKLIDTIALTGLDLQGVETTIIALVRAISNSQDPPSLIIHIGSGSSDFCITVGDKIALAHSIPTAGTSLTRSIMQALNLDLLQAEQYKRSYGLSRELLEGKVRLAMAPVFNSIISEAKKVINSFEASNRSKKIIRAVLSGGSALLPEITSEVTEKLGISETIIADPFRGIKADSNLTIPPERSVYTVAVGLAMK